MALEPYAGIILTKINIHVSADLKGVMGNCELQRQAEEPTCKLIG